MDKKSEGTKEEDAILTLKDVELVWGNSGNIVYFKKSLSSSNLVYMM